MMQHGTIYALIFCGALGLGVNAEAQKAGGNPAKTVIPDERTESYVDGNRRIEKSTGVPRAIYNAGYAVTPGNPIAMAQQYLRDHAELLGLKSDLSDLTHLVTRETAGGYHVRFNQRLSRIPVYQGEITVTINRHNVVTFVANGYQKEVALADTTRAISAPGAIARAKNHLGARGKINLEKAELIVYQNHGATRLAFKTSIVPAEDQIGDWEVLIDAKTGEVFRAEDKAFHYRGRTVSTGSASAAATGTAQVFDPDPIAKSGSTYGLGGFVDNNDANSSDLTNVRTPVTLPDLTLQSNQYELKGPYAEIVDSEAPLEGTFSQTSSAWNYTRDADAFEAANVYYHIDKSMRYINVTLGVPLMPFQYAGGVRADPHGLNGDDNSHYLNSTGQLAFGEGGVDDAEDLEVILHELGHGIHDWASHGQISQVNGLSEGCGDYWAASYVRSLNYWLSSESEYNWVFHWDGHNEYWAGRVVNYGAIYPGGLTDQIHTDGQMWSSTLMSIWNNIGRTATDQNFLECLSMLNSTSNQNDAANAFYQADAALHGGAYQATILPWLQQRGYTINTGTAPAAPGNLIATAISGSQINLTWTDNATNETGFYVERKTGASGTYAQLAALGANVVSYSNTGLAAGTAYYYRTRAYNGSGNSSYSNEANATTPGNANLALNKTATATSTNSSNTASKAVDGSTSTYWSSVKITTSNKLQYLTVNLGSSMTVSKAVVKWNSTNYAKIYKMQTSLTGTTFTTVYTDNAGNGGDDTCIFTATTAQYVRLEMSSNNKTYYQVKEFELYASAAKSANSAAAEVITATIPDAIVLQPNYPNPFNPSTTISFSLPERMRVTLKIFNVAGQEVARLVDGEQERGVHQVRFDAAPLTGGVYFSVLQAGQQRQVRRLALIK